MTDVSKWYLHNAASSVSGTLPGTGSSQSSTTPSQIATGAGTNRLMDGTIGTSQVSIAQASLGQTAAQTVFFRRFVSPLLAAQTIPASASTLAARVGDQTSNSTNSSFFIPYPVVYVWRPSTGALVGMLRDTPTSGGSLGAGTSEAWVSTGFVTPTSVVCQDGDVLICEIWGRCTQGMSQSYTWTFYYDGTSEWTSDGSAVSSAAAILLTPAITLFTGTSKSDTDANSTTTENATVPTALISGTDANGTLSEIISDRTATLLDSNSGITEASSVSKTVLDANSTVTESSVVSVPITSSDANSVITEQAGSIRFSASDSSATITESALVTFATTSTDASNAASEIVALAQLVLDSNAVFAEAVSGRIISYAESGSDSEATAIKLATSDSNSTTTEAANNNLPVSASDTNAGISEATVSAVIQTDTDVNSTITQSTIVNLSYSVSDSATSTQSEALVVPGITASDSNNTLAENAGMKYTMSDVNSTFTEVSSTGVFKSDTDSGVGGSEIASNSAASMASSDSGSDAESVLQAATAASSDLGIGAEVTVTLGAMASVAESVSTAENTVISQAYVQLDSGSGAEGQMQIVILTSMQASSTQTESLAALFNSEDFATTTESASHFSSGNLISPTAKEKLLRAELTQAELFSAEISEPTLLDSSQPAILKRAVKSWRP